MKEITNRKQASKFLKISKKKIFNFHKYKNNDWSYEDEDGYCHLFRKIDDKYIELTKDIDAYDVCSCGDGNWEYYDKNWRWSLFDKNNKLIASNKQL